jgi:UDP-N-acetylglucosamine 3-dehydrogenase
MKKISIALIGYGYWGKKIAEVLDKSTFFKIKMIFDKNSLKSEKFTNSIIEIVEDKEIDAVFICTPSSTHFKYSKIFLLSDKHVFCEKPLAYSVNEVEELMNISIEKKKIIYTDYTFLFSEAIQKILSLSSTSINYIEISMTQFGKFYKEDVIFTLGTHALSILDEIVPINEIEFTHFNLLHDSYGYATISETIFSYNGINVKIYLSLNSPHKSREIKIFTKDSIFEYSFGKEYNFYKYSLSTDGHKIDFNDQIHYPDDKNIEKSILNFYNCIIGEKQSNILKSFNISKFIDKLKI